MENKKFLSIYRVEIMLVTFLEICVLSSICVCIVLSKHLHFSYLYTLIIPILVIFSIYNNYFNMKKSLDNSLLKHLYNRHEKLSFKEFFNPSLLEILTMILLACLLFVSYYFIFLFISSKEFYYSFPNDFTFILILFIILPAIILCTNSHMPIFLSNKYFIFDKNKVFFNGKIFSYKNLCGPVSIIAYDDFNHLFCFQLLNEYKNIIKSENVFIPVPTDFMIIGTSVIEIINNEYFDIINKNIEKYNRKKPVVDLYKRTYQRPLINVEVLNTDEVIEDESMEHILE